jgi:dipeptidyl aminopeptidase/acylaminoacyl peptidase
MALAAGFLSAGAAPLETYGSLPTLENVQISPDGSKLAYLKTQGDQRFVAVQSLADRKILARLHFDNTKVRAIYWPDEQHVLIQGSVTATASGLSGPEREWWMVNLFDVAGHQPIKVKFDAYWTRTLNTVWGNPMFRRIDGKSYIYIGGDDIPGRWVQPALFRIDVETGVANLVLQGTPATRAWLVDDSGVVVAEEDYYERDKRWSLKIRRDNRLTEVVTDHAEIDYPNLLGLGPDGATAIFQTVENGNAIWRSLSLKDGSWGLALGDGNPMSATILNPSTGRMIGGVLIGTDTKDVFFDPAMQKHWDATVRAFPGERVRFISQSADFSKIVVQVNGAHDGFVYELVDYTTHHADLIGDVYDGVTEIAEVRAITYPAADGLQIPAYLTLPPGRAPKNLPIVVMPHGGPAARDTGDFDWWAQALAAQGYAVLQPNFRGSALNEKFIAAGFGEYGRKMQTDLSDGVRYLAAAGFIDPKRVAIEGASYGGYAALAAAALDPVPYRCAISVAGIADLPRFLNWIHRNNGRATSVTERYWDRFMGAANRGDSILERLSPIHYVDHIDMPVLLIHGKDDTVVPYEQSDRMADAMKDAHKTVEFVTLREEDHWLSRSATRLQMLQASVAFLNKCNPPD